MFSSRKDRDSKNLNRVIVQIGTQQINKDILDFTVFRDGKEYTLNELLEKILYLENENKSLKNAIKVYESANNSTINLLTKAAELLSAKSIQLEKEVEELKEKCKYL